MKIEMKQFIKMILNKFFLICSILAILQSCNTNDQTVNCVPLTTVNFTINTNLPLYSNLNNPGGYVEIPASPTTGTRGLIVVRSASGFKAYDRNAPHICPGEKTTLYVKDGIRIVCDADNSEWILLTGQPTKVANRAPRTYQVYLNANNTLTITN